MRVLLLGVTVFVQACSSLSPVKFETQATSKTPLLSDCRNVSLESSVSEFDTNSYLTTLGSAWIEGSGAGVLQGTEGRGPVGDTLRKKMTVVKEGGRSLATQEFSKRTFCRRVQANYETVVAAVAGLLPRLGYEIEFADEQGGEFQTVFVTREERHASWVDRYEIELNEPAGGGVGVRVIRDVFISRQGSEFMQGTSNGFNEAWILKEISKSVEGAGPN